MSYSNSSLNCFANCMAKYKLNYIEHVQPDSISPHLTFGAMAHEVLEKAGRLRDDAADKVIDEDYYDTIIPSEVLYNDLKNFFQIKSWHNYFTPIIKQIATYEHNCIKELSAKGDVQVEREVKLQLTPEQLKNYGLSYCLDEPFVGVVDLLLYTKDSAIILDYKFSTKRKDQDDFDMNSQLPLYALLVHLNYDIPLHNIQYGYIDIPKQEFGIPSLLTNGTVSRAKSQNVSQYTYEQFVKAIHGDDPYYNCEPGGYYYDAWCNFALNKPAYISKQYLDEEVYENIIHDLITTAEVISKMKAYMPYNQAFVRKYDSYSCKGCEYLKSCKPWLSVNGDAL